VDSGALRPADARLAIARPAAAELATAALPGSTADELTPADELAATGVATAKISWRQTKVATSSNSAANAATPIDTATSIRLPAITPAASSPIAASATDKMTPNRITLELRLER
jgi:hypothetical protein